MGPPVLFGALVAVRPRPMFRSGPKHRRSVSCKDGPDPEWRPVMRHGPDIAPIAALVGDPARAAMLTALMDGGALTAGELAREAGVTAQTVSGHLTKMEEAGLLVRRKQGRHRFVALAGDEVGRMLEAMMGVAAASGQTRTRTGPKEPALREARVCYDHLAGGLAVGLLRTLIERGAILEEDEDLTLTDDGATCFERFGIDLPTLRRARRPVCRACLDWSERRFHLGGGLGAAMLEQLYARGWAKRKAGTRVIRFSNSGMAQFRDRFQLRN
ncbi:winged helix-turn-helix domain-containing protein [Roseicyclus sp. F158]|uniref:Winged helix-turn-helix domain-containing protein n=1 Tax=Tropicimonas omnivorans TaxID=3075590 RepID=A0ABU3DKV1_9RHOB|nr:winged helix-turn-helix domain-containing protein [Roseicyclus sp. F158]MDT0684164.1 winged helix-turn-helix domain-containing protein [Roseicyclus sp. F158]